MLTRRKPIRRVSKKRAKQNKEYTILRKAFLAGHPKCEACRHVTGMAAVAGNGDDLMANRATEVHHVHKRSGTHFLDCNTWLAVCAPCHRWIHEHPGQARQRGLLA